MHAETTHRRQARPWIFNDLERGASYRATTREGSFVGVYLGMEAPYGDWAVLLRHHAGTHSIGIGDIASMVRTSA